MARAYGAVLVDLGVEFQVIGRSEASASAFEAEVPVRVVRGGLENVLRSAPHPDRAIVAVGVDGLAGAAVRLLQSGCARILLEKPGGLDDSQVRSVAEVSAAAGAVVLVAYNRRFYESTARARRLIVDDGGVESFDLEFGERVDAIGSAGFPDSVLRRWFLANSTHPVDLAFHLAGRPVELDAERSGSLDWHPSAAVFRGSGTTDSGARFQYRADWRTTGSWGLEIETRRRRLLLRPLERLRIVVDGIEDEVPPADDFDQRFKPGLHRQVAPFLDGDDRQACTLADQVENCAVYDRIAGYGSNR